MRQERFGERDLTFSAWHRLIDEDDWSWLDIDHYAYCKKCSEPIYVAELALDVGQAWKNHKVTRQLAIRLGVPGLLILYGSNDGAITHFRIRRIAPDYSPSFARVEPAVLIEWIAKTRAAHICGHRFSQEVEEALSRYDPDMSVREVMTRMMEEGVR
jgi:hypothetical protein